MLFALTSTAQNQFIKFSSTVYDNLISSQKSVYDRADTSGHYDSIWICTIGDIDSCQDSGYLYIDVSELWPDSIKLNVHHAEYDSDSNYKWAGYNVWSGDTLDTLITARMYSLAYNGNKFGYLAINEKDYEYWDLGGGLGILCLVKKGEYPAVDNSDLGSVNNTSVTMNCSGDCTISVAFLHTPEAVDKEPYLEGKLRLAIYQANQVLRESRVDASVSFKLVLIDDYAYVPEATLAQDLDYFRSNSTVASIRSANKADIIVLVVPDDDDKHAGVSRYNFLPYIEYGHAVVAVKDLVPNFVFIHEAGHILGCMHNLSTRYRLSLNNNFQALPSKRYAFGEKLHYKNNSSAQFSLAKHWRLTIMATDQTDKNSPMIPHFSDPDRELNFVGVDVPLGTSESESYYTWYNPTDPSISAVCYTDNVSVVNEHACRVANFYTNNNPIVGWVEGPTEVCINETETFTFNVACGVPAIYEWYYSYDGINYTKSTEVTNTYNHTIPIVYSESLFIKGVVKGAGPSYPQMTYIKHCVIDLILPCD